MDEQIKGDLKIFCAFCVLLQVVTILSMWMMTWQ